MSLNYARDAACDPRTAFAATAALLGVPIGGNGFEIQVRNLKQLSSNTTKPYIVASSFLSNP
jgi:hypothetical protein